MSKPKRTMVLKVEIPDHLTAKQAKDHIKAGLNYWIVRANMPQAEGIKIK